MDRINGANTVDIGGGKRGFRKKNKAAGLSGTEVTEVFMNNVQEELLATIEQSGLAASDADQKQHFKAIRSQKANWMGVFGGTANALTAAPTVAFTALADLVGVPISGTTGAAANTGAMTLAVNGLAATAITWQDGTALANGDLPAGSEITLRYDGTAFRLEYHLSPTKVKSFGFVWGQGTGTLSAQTDLQNALNAKANLTANTFTGDQTITKTEPRFAMNKGASGQACAINGMTNGIVRWVVSIGDANGEIGSNAGSDVAFQSFNDAGGFIGTPFQIKRASGAWGINGQFGTLNQVLSSRDTTNTPLWQSLGDLQPQLQYEARWSAATNSATLFSAATAWVTLPLNTVIANNIPSATASAGVISLPAGTYRARFWGAATPSGGTGYKFRLRNTTAGTTLGLTAIAGTGGYYPQIACPGECEFTLAATSNIELQGFTTGGTTVSNLTSSDGEPLIGASVTFTRVK